MACARIPAEEALHSWNTTLPSQ